MLRRSWRALGSATAATASLWGFSMDRRQGWRAGGLEGCCEGNRNHGNHGFLSFLLPGYRSLVMRAQFLAQDRAHLSEAVIKAQNESDMQDLKRLGRYLAGRPRVVDVYHPQRPTNVIKVHADSDHAGCLLTRRSTTGYTISIGTHCVKHGSNLQSTMALSSGECEFYALTRGAALGHSLKSLMADWGQKYDLIVLSDSSAARGTAARRGLGKLRHVQTRYLSVQDRVANNDLTVKSVNTKQNLADPCTKPVSRETCEKHMRTLCQEFREGKASGEKALEPAKVYLNYH